MQRRYVVISIALLLAQSLPPARAEDAFVGQFIANYGGKRFELELELVGAGRYEGALRRNDRAALVQARRFGDRLFGRAGDETGGAVILIEVRGMGISLQIADDAPLFLRRR